MIEEKMMSHREKNQQTAERFLATMNSGDKTAMLSCLKPDVIWHIPASQVGKPFYGPTSAQALVDLFAGGAAEFYDVSTMKITPNFLLVGDQNAVFQFHMAGTALNGNSYENIYVLTFRFEDGLIAEGWESFDTLNFHRVVIEG